MHAEPKPAPDEDTVPPGDDSNTDPTPPLPADPGRNGDARNPSASAGKKHPPMDEEPEINNRERGIPSDGGDPEGGDIRDIDKPTEASGDKPIGEIHGH
ncbi:hypothetical protein [Polaromonas eurypsychrophila]|uniref:Uncharacterized protein n=1 Tax=Polaromonas eurypsychrophila TaxID=1614635 RepID=A0A916SH07_9BURK|nr:hypothetical protein [Polaromonas eurypsychrophila]GGA97065.1 hypothetical protein GCM10011496_17670 [Polaromonas eurypsychrophila]